MTDRPEHVAATVVQASRLERVLSARRTFFVLLALHLVVVLGMLYSTRGRVLGDAPSYIGLAEGILHGEYTQWWALDEDIPDTWRTPGFPLYLAVVIKVFGTWRAVFGVQVLLYALALYLTLRTIERFDPRLLVRNLFLLLLLPLVNVPFYIGQAYPEIPSLVAISAVLFILTRRGVMPWTSAIALGALYGFIFQCKPVFMLFPPLAFVVGWWVERGRFDWKPRMLAVVTFALTLLPYGFWNKKHHGVFSVTPLEGGAGMVHIGFWAGKIPGYQEHVYWHNFTGDECVRFVPEDSVKANIAAFEREWAEVKVKLAPLMTRTDSVMLAARPFVGSAPSNTFSTRYTLERERLLMDLNVEHITSEPGYVLRYKAWSALRLWVIGLQRGEYRKASTLGRVRLLYATFSTGAIFLLAVVAIPWAYRRKRIAWADTWPFVLLLVYFGAIHLPFVIQARYTTPVRLVMVALMALSIARLWKGRPEGPA